MEVLASVPLHLVCTRLGACCHGHQVSICPWELALLAQGLGLGAREFRDSYTDCYGSRLIFDGTPYPHGPAEHTGKSSCRFYRDGIGCTVHQHRPLACRLYPLGRKRHEGKASYFYFGEKLSCFELCPSIQEMPLCSLDNFLLDQRVSEHAAAQDGYAILACGMVTAAATIAASPHVDSGQLEEYFRELCEQSLQELASRIPVLWLDRLTIPDLNVPLTNVSEFINAHGQFLGTAITTDFSQSANEATAMNQAARLYLSLALHLGQSVGLELAEMAQFLRKA